MEKLFSSDGTGSGALTLINGVGNIVLGNICLVSRIIDDDSAYPVGIVHPLLQLILGDGGTGGVVGKHR